MKKLGILLLGVLFITACNSKSDQEVVQEVVKLQSEAAIPLDASLKKISSIAVNEDLNVSLYSKSDTLRTEYETLYFQVQDKDGNIINNAPIYIEPFMAMGEEGHGGHGVPTLQPVYNPENQTYEGGVFFSMQGYWDIKMKINGEDASFTQIFSLYKRNTEKLFKIDEGSDGEHYSVVLKTPEVEEWKVGENEFSILINKVMNNVMLFPEEKDLEVSLFVTPENSDSEGDKSEIIQLKNEGNGVYSGKINLPSAGAWNLNYSLKKDGETLVEQSKLGIKF